MIPDTLLVLAKNGSSSQTRALAEGKYAWHTKNACRLNSGWITLGHVKPSSGIRCLHLESVTTTKKRLDESRIYRRNRVWRSLAGTLAANVG